MQGPAGMLRRMYRRLKPAPGPWDHFLRVLDDASLTHDPGMTDDAKRALFKRNVTMVEVEPHAYCNRTCSFCPNSTIDRLTVTTPMDRGLYEAVLDDLASIDYGHVLRFARYSEPMAHEHIYDMVAVARQRLPRATIDIVTNGDYLKPPALARLRDAGLSALRISVYLPRNVAWTVPAARHEMERLGRRLEITPVWDRPTAVSVGCAFPYPGMEIVAFSHHFDEIGYDRGQLVETLVDRGYARRSPCFLVFSNFTMDFNGKVMPCCNLRSDHPQHREFVLGDLTDRRQRIFDVYAGRLSTEWRRGLARVDEKGGPCRTCKQKTLEGSDLEQLRTAVETRLDARGVQL